MYCFSFRNVESYTANCTCEVGDSGIADPLSKFETKGLGLRLGELVWFGVALFWLKLLKELPSVRLVPFAMCKRFHLELPVL